VTTSQENRQAISIIMPVHNGESTIGKTLASLSHQTIKYDELIIIDDASKDKSVECIKDFFGTLSEYKLLSNEKQMGLAATYNRGIKAASGDLIVTLHQDIVLENNSLEKLVEPFEEIGVVAATHIVSHPIEIWRKYNFWQKCFFARLAGKDFSGIDGKFDCFRKSALEKVGLFDEVNFKTAGEDGDMVWKIQRIGKIARTNAKIIHLHKIDPNFSWKDIIRKQKQYSEAQGALLARGRVRNIYSLTKTFFREILLIGLAIPFIWIVSLFLILLYSILYTKLVFQKEYRDKRIFLLPFLSIFLLFISFFYTLKGLIYGRQKI
jgi:GT2 family glycosyltransferase